MKRACLAAALLLTAAPAHAEQDPLIEAVSFALTGSDTTPVKVIDRSSCVFLVLGGIYHFNNIVPERITLQPMQDLTSTWFEVSLHGSSTIYEYTGKYYTKADASDPTFNLARSMEEHERPRQTSDFSYKFYSLEKDRLIRAWQFIYANGCTGAKQPF